MRRSLRWLAAVVLVVAYCAAAVDGAEATVSAIATNASNSLASSALYSPTGLSAAPLGRTASVSWTASSPQNGNGYVVSGVNVVTSGATCPTTATSYAFVGGAAGTSFTDSTSMAGGTEGTYVCYLVRSGYASTAPGSWVADPNWTSANTLPTVKTPIGFFATSVTMANGGTAGQLGPGDTIVVVFDQAVSIAGLTVTQVCAAVGTKTVYLGSTHGLTTCNVGSTVGTLTGINLSSFLSLHGAWNASVAWSNGNKTMTITLAASVMGGAITVGAGTTTYNPAALTSASGASPICTTAICKPTTTSVP